MPRKQRFKPSRKPQPQQKPIANPQTDERKDVQRQGQDIEREVPAREGMRDIETERD